MTLLLPSSGSKKSKYQAASKLLRKVDSYSQRNMTSHRRKLENSSQMGEPQISQSYDWLRLSYLVSLDS